jgi:hypothetical protein
VRRGCVQRRAGGGEGVDRRISRRDARRRRLDHRERRQRLRSSCGGQQRDDATVRVADQVIPGLEQVGDENRVRREVDAFDRGIRRESGTIEDDELEPIGKGALGRPGSPPPDDAAMDEDDPLHRAILTLRTV